MRWMIGARISSIAKPILPPLMTMLVGLDMIGNSVTEINVTSPTCFQEIQQQTGFDVAGMFVDALERAAATAVETANG